MYYTIDFNKIDITNAPPETEPERQYYFIAKCREYVRKEVFQKKPLGRRRYLMSKPARNGICEFSIRYVWNGAKARLRWNTSLPQRPLLSLHQRKP